MAFIGCTNARIEGTGAAFYRRRDAHALAPLPDGRATNACSGGGLTLFHANLATKAKRDTTLGSRTAEVHDGSSRFSGDSGQAESNSRRWHTENDWLAPIVALPPA